MGGRHCRRRVLRNVRHYRRRGEGRNADLLPAGAIALVTAYSYVLSGLSSFLEDEQTLEAIRDKVRSELPSLFSLFRADAFSCAGSSFRLRKFIEEARNDPDHPLRREFGQFVKAFIENL